MRFAYFDLKGSLWQNDLCMCSIVRVANVAACGMCHRIISSIIVMLISEFRKEMLKWAASFCAFYVDEVGRDGSSESLIGRTMDILFFISHRR